MRRSPIVLSATIAGTAAILAFHPQAPTTRTVTASTPSATPASTSSSSATSSSNASIAGSATGQSIATRYGNAQVRVTVKSGKITKIEALQLQSNDPRSVQISSTAAPILQEEALTSQTAAVDAVSGATYTSASYTQSLQSALDKLGFKAADGSVATQQVP
ncbi:MAG: hypothetical protein QOE31_3014 [Solirubrobacteraceae bacterium]|nr:hypothetical protein [Solirubrobacteraceae bacterium]